MQTTTDTVTTTVIAGLSVGLTTAENDTMLLLFTLLFLEENLRK